MLLLSVIFLLYCLTNHYFGHGQSWSQDSWFWNILIQYFVKWNKLSNVKITYIFFSLLFLTSRVNLILIKQIKNNVNHNRGIFTQIKNLINILSNHYLCASHLSCIVTHNLFKLHNNPGDTVYIFLQKAKRGTGV